jgi:RNA polymerase sigma factor (TIGR02999 family)
MAFLAEVTGNEHAEGSGERTLGLSDELLAETYDLLRRMASRQLSGKRRSATLNTTLIVHEAWLKLSHNDERRFNDRDHYLATASQAMRQVLVDHARRKLAEKRGAGAEHVDIDEYPVAASQAERQLLDLDAALQDLAKRDPDLEQIVECRFFAGLTVSETARVLGRSVRTVERDWARARTYLAEYLAPDA